MKKILLCICIGFSSMLVYAQQSFIGIQNSPRKGMVHAAMNPAELNHLSRNVEVNLFAVGATVGNNVLKFEDLINEDDLLELALDRVEGPLNANAEIQLLGPSFGFIVNKWSFGIISQVSVRGDIKDLDADLGSSFDDGDFDD